MGSTSKITTPEKKQVGQYAPPNSPKHNVLASKKGGKKGGKKSKMK